MAQRLQRARDEAQAALAEIGEHIHGDEARLQVLQETIADAQPRLEHLREEDGVRQDALRDAEAALADWQQRQDTHAREQAEAARAGDVERTRVDYLDRQGLEADRRREQLANERAALDLSALAEAFAGIEVQHEAQKASLDTTGGELEQRKPAVTELQDQPRNAQNDLAAVRNDRESTRHNPNH